MKKVFGVLMAVVVTALVVFAVASCNKSGSGTAADKGYDLYIFNTKGENAAQFDAMTKAYQAETGVRVKAFSIGAGQDSSAPLSTEMNSKNYPVIYCIENFAGLRTWQQGGYVVDFSKVTDNAAFQKLASDISPSLRLSLGNGTNYGIPFNVEGYGYIVDTQMLGDLFGAANVDSVLAGIKAASYSEWEALVKAIDAWIKSPSAASVTLNGTSYALSATKTGLAANLNGVFAVMGSESWTYGDHFINVAINAGFPASLDADSADEAKIRSMKGAFTAYAKALDLKTSYLAGKNGPAVRGQDFVSPANFGYDQTVQIFADSKAVFFKQGNWAYGNIAGVNAPLAERLEFVPVKMPFTQADLVRNDGLTVDKLNSSIPVFVPNYYVVNDMATAAEKKAAYDFLVWMNTSATGQRYVVDEFAFIPYNADPATTTVPNSLGNSIIGYIKSGNIISDPYHGTPANWTGDEVGRNLIMAKYLLQSAWTQADYDAIADSMVESWLKMKQ